MFGVSGYGHNATGSHLTLRSPTQPDTKFTCERHEYVFASERDQGDVASSGAEINESLWNAQAIEDAIEAVEDRANVAPSAVILRRKRIAGALVHEQQAEVPAGLSGLNDLVNDELLPCNRSQLTDGFIVIHRRSNGLIEDTGDAVPS